jgi:hypothetical protein
LLMSYSLVHHQGLSARPRECLTYSSVLPRLLQLSRYSRLKLLGPKFRHRRPAGSWSSVRLPTQPAQMVRIKSLLAAQLNQSHTSKAYHLPSGQQIILMCKVRLRSLVHLPSAVLLRLAKSLRPQQWPIDPNVPSSLLSPAKPRDPHLPTSTSRSSRGYPRRS